MTLDRRDFLASSLATAGALAAPAAAAAQARAAGDPFRLDYAPHFDMFKAHAGDDLVAQLEFMAEQGFRSLEDNWLGNRDTKTQEKVKEALDRLKMRMGVFVAHASMNEVTFASEDPAMREKVLTDVRKAVETAQRVGAKWCTVVPGAYHKGREWDFQTATVIDNLKRAAEICETTGLVMVLEPLNWWRDHGGVFLHKIPQAYLICRAVGSPSCKILFDIYHQQISEGNLIPNIDRAWEEIAYFQIGDNPGRKEPGTGEINYKNVFGHIQGKGYTGILGMEHGNAKPGKEGELALIAAYRAVDPA
jgi:hydroxypyruvate isomerase